MPKVAGILIETTFGSIVEIILFLILISKHDSSSSAENGDEGNLVPVIQAAILGSALTNLLLCLGLCFFFGGIRHPSQKLHAICRDAFMASGEFLWYRNNHYSGHFGLPYRSEACIYMSDGNHLDFSKMYLIRSTFYSALKSEMVPEFPGRMASSQHSIFNEVIETDEHRNMDREAGIEKPKFALAETTIALVISLVLVTLLLIFLVEGIKYVVHSGGPDQFLGLILL
ncbi:hypothetical protein LY76DRAFT_609762 [Colletotrichum caudatum]|nr:hypothetical protein LY76DRAFT_609762 [Colletotrichum caudatum]